jgi:hypothetical protein
MSKVYKHRVLYSSIKLWNSLSTSCGECRINVAAVSLYLSGFPELHLSCLLNLKGPNAYTETCQRGISEIKY